MIHQFFKLLDLSFIFLSMIAFGFVQTVAGQDMTILHSEPPDYPPLARLTGSKGPVSVSASIDPNGTVSSATVIDGHPLLQRSAESAARKWVFRASENGEPRQVKIVFIFDGIRETEDEGFVEVTRPDPFTIRLVYRQSTLERLPRENGQIPERKCPIHGETMATELVDIRYGLSRSYVDDGSKKAKRFLARMKAYRQARDGHFPETNRWVGGGCIVGPTKRAEVYYCQACRNAEEAWLRAHPEIHPDE